MNSPKTKGNVCKLCGKLLHQAVTRQIPATYLMLCAPSLLPHGLHTPCHSFDAQLGRLRSSKDFLPASLRQLPLGVLLLLLLQSLSLPGCYCSQYPVTVLVGTIADRSHVIGSMVFVYCSATHAVYSAHCCLAPSNRDCHKCFS